MKRIALFSIIVAYILIVFGGYVASSESGMGCGPEWPLCNGDVIPVMEGETLIEFAHRGIGLFLFVLSFILFILIRRISAESKLRRMANWMLGLLVFQVLAGATVVVLDLPAIVVTLHLLIAMVYLFTLLWIYRSGNEAQRINSISYSKQKLINRHLNLVLILLLMTLAFGAYIKHQTYGLACGWLECGDTVFPTNGPMLLQSAHRALAVVTTLYILTLTILSYIKGFGRLIQKRLLLASSIILIQLSTGVLTIMTYISIPWAVIHLAIATALFMIIADTRIVNTPIAYTIESKRTTSHNNFT